MERLFRFFVVLSIFLTTLPLTRAQERSSVAGSVSRDTILIGDQVEWKSGKIIVPNGSRFIYSDPGRDLTSTVEIVGGLKLDTLSVHSDFTELELRAIITSFDSGSHVVPPFEFFIERLDGRVDTLHYSVPDLEVNTIQIDTLTFVPFDIKGEMGYPLTFWEIFRWVLLAIGTLLIIYIVYRVIRNLRENKTLLGKPVVKDPPHIIALRELDKLRNKKLWERDQKQYYTEVTDILRSYIERVFDVQAMEQTSKEIIDDLQSKDIDKKEFEELKDLFNLSDLVKFAKYTATSQESESAIPVAVRFVNSTFLHEIEEVEKEIEIESN